MRAQNPPAQFLLICLVKNCIIYILVNFDPYKLYHSVHFDQTSDVVFLQDYNKGAHLTQIVNNALLKGLRLLWKIRTMLKKIPRKLEKSNQDDIKQKEVQVSQ